MIKDILENLINDENQEKILVVLDPFLFKIKLFSYVVITLMAIIALTLIFITIKIHSIK